MCEFEFSLAAKTRLVIKKMPDNRTLLEIQKPGIDRFGHGWIIEGAAFLEPQDAHQLATLLSPSETMTNSE
jgi:hypothetical protein